jgi:hypothetical protein
MGTKWDHSTAIDDKKSWDETIYSWKASNILGWSLSTVLGMYTSAFGVTKQQLMLGFERKINVLQKYEWYYTQPTKVLCSGEGKIDLAATSKTTPSLQWRTLFTEFQSTTDERTALEGSLKSTNTTETVVGKKTETYGTHSLTVAESSTETVAMEKTINSTMALNLTGGASVAISSGSVSIAMSPASIVLTAPTINIG